jgi:hypothetical protein
MSFTRRRDARSLVPSDNKMTCGTGRVHMTAAQFDLIGPTAAEELLRARFDALAEWGCPLGEALLIATHVEVDIVDAVSLLRHGCPAELVLPILT